MFSPQEIQEVVDIGYLNGLFVLARSIGFIGAQPSCMCMFSRQLSACCAGCCSNRV
jgi:hypothetical protein